MTADTIELDLALLERYADTGDADAFAQIVHRYARVVYAASIRILGDEGAAQDVSQETFFRLMKQPGLVTISLAGWLHRTATHLALDARRSEMARKHREKTYGTEQQQICEVEPRWEEVSSLVDQALDELAEPTRSLLIRHFLQSVPQAFLAAEMNLSPATLSRRIKAGLAELQQHLKQKGVYIAIAGLAGFFIDHATHAMPPVLISELGKMQMIASFRQPLPTVQLPPIHPPHLYQWRQTAGEFVPAKFAAVFIIISLIVAAYCFATTMSWEHAQILPVPQHSLE